MTNQNHDGQHHIIIFAYTKHSKRKPMSFYYCLRRVYSCRQADELIGHNNNVISVSYRLVYYLTLKGTIRVVDTYYNSRVGTYVIIL